jgi:hypothetical protein
VNSHPAFGSAGLTHNMGAATQQHPQQAKQQQQQQKQSHKQQLRQQQLRRQHHPPWGMRHTSIALYFYGATKKSLHKSRATFGNMLFQTSYSCNYYLQLLYLQFLSKTHLYF